MLIKGITDEDFVNYKVPSMFIATATCSFKCDKEYGSPICQNSALAKQPNIDILMTDIFDRYINNPITKAIIFGGLEPFDQLQSLLVFIDVFRNELLRKDDIVIYTGYNKDELPSRYYPEENAGPYLMDYFRDVGNIVIKYGRYIPCHKPHFDPVLGVNLASDNQYAERIS